MMVLATFIDFVLVNLSDFQLGTQSTVVLGLILGEVSKYINNKLIK
jgi:hypothetical protein